MKQLSMRRLPCVLSLHLKRFEHSKEAVKIDSFISFPLQLNMLPYLSAVRGNQTSAEQELSDSGAFQYELFAVINHYGGMESGHYTTFVRHRDQVRQFARRTHRVVY